MLGTPIPFQVPNVQLPVVSLSCTYGAIRLTLFMSKVFKSGLFKCTSKCCKNKVKIKRHEVEKKERGQRKTVVSDAICEQVEEKVKEKVEEKIEEVKEQVLVKVDEKLQQGIDSLKNSTGSTEIVEKTIEKTVEINPSNNNTMIADKTKDDIKLAEINGDDVFTENNATVIAVSATTEQIKNWDFDTPPEGQTKTRAHGNSLIRVRQKTSEQVQYI